MKLVNLIDFLINPKKLEVLYREEGLNTDSEALLIYMENSLDIESEIKFFEIEETDDDLVFEKGDIQYVQLFPVDHAIDLIESDLELKNRGYSNLEIAERLLEYRIKDA
ncbi:hypothetical protein [Dyadobacter tibetensis]|uniref:hypothetical protein n=1 Tax=Dyadobacter tibetensis TaxID=1211851 RepID=UPI000470B810|nr:hypothetical protein [Dyadobacter tibetensis]